MITLYLFVIGLSSGLVYGLKDCTYGNATYTSGQGFKSTDGCNTCGCSNGAVMCTLMFCLPAGSHVCHYGGHVYQEGETFNSIDGCNGCGCNQGSVVCTQRACAPAVREIFSHSACHYGGHTYQNGESFKATDGCNTCDCNSGSARCTAMVCHMPIDRNSCHVGGHTYHDGHTFNSADGCNMCMCRSGSVACTERACAPVVRQSIFPSDCHYAGHTYHSGSAVSFNSTHGTCNYCFCISGTVACPPIPCIHPVSAIDINSCHYGGHKYHNGMTFKSTDGCNDCECHAGMVDCTARMCP